ncbi:response regulator [Coraliomargarita sp. W4R72]
MYSRRNRLNKIQLSPIAIAGIYCLVSAAWIFLTSFQFEVFPDASQHPSYELIKGIFFVLITSYLLWALCKSFRRQIEGVHQHYKTYVAKSPIAIAVYSPEGALLDFNQAACSLTGYSKEELLTKSIFELDASPNRDEAKRVLTHIFKEGSLTFDWRIVRKDGSFAIVEIDAILIEPEKALYFVQDRTQEKAADRKLRMLNAMLRAVRRVNQAIVGEKEVAMLNQKICEILITDRDFDFAWIALFNKTNKELVYLSHAPTSQDDGELRRYLNSGVFPDCFSQFKRKDSLLVSLNPSKQCHELPIHPSFANDALICAPLNCSQYVGHIALLVNHPAATDEEELSLFREVTEDLNHALHSLMLEKEKNRVMEDLTAATEQAKAANEAKNQFLSVMSHEMRTPLNPIIGYCDLLLEDNLDQETNESLNQIKKSAGHLLALVDEIFYFMSLQKESDDSEEQSFNLLSFCQNIIDTFPSHQTGATSLILKNGNHELSALPEALDVIGVPCNLRHLLGNLLNNACKYTPNGSIILNVGIQHTDDESVECVFNVIDHGIGIEAEQIKDLFTPFSQADYSYTRHYEGVGLGLAICKRIADVSGGSLKVESTLSEGSCFTYQIRFKRANKEAEDKQLPTVTVKAPASAEPSEPPKQAHILIVEDNATNARLAQKILERMKVTSAIVENGQRAVEICQAQSFDIILMDLSLPIMNGFDAASAIRTMDTSNRSTPIIALTAHTDAASKERSIKVGMNDFLTKPIQLAALQKILHRYI